MVEGDAARTLGVEDAHGLSVAGAALVVVDDGVLEGGLAAVADPHGGTLGRGAALDDDVAEGGGGAGGAVGLHEDGSAIVLGVGTVEHRLRGVGKLELHTVDDDVLGAFHREQLKGVHGIVVLDGGGCDDGGVLERVAVGGIDIGARKTAAVAAVDLHITIQREVDGPHIGGMLFEVVDIGHRSLLDVDAVDGIVVGGVLTLQTDKLEGVVEIAQRRVPTGTGLAVVVGRGGRGVDEEVDDRRRALGGDGETFFLDDIRHAVVIAVDGSEGGMGLVGPSVEVVGQLVEGVDGAVGGQTLLVEVGTEETGVDHRRLLLHTVGEGHQELVAVMGGACDAVGVGVDEGGIDCRQHLHLTRGAPVGDVVVLDAAVFHECLEVLADGGARGGVLYAVVAHGVVAVEHAVVYRHLVAGIESAGSSLCDAVDDGGRAVAGIADDGHLTHGTAAVGVDAATLDEGHVVGHDAGIGVGFVALVLVDGGNTRPCLLRTGDGVGIGLGEGVATGEDGQSAALARGTVGDHAIAEAGLHGCHVADGGIGLDAHATAVAIRRADALGLGGGDKDMVADTAAVHIDGTTVARGLTALYPHVAHHRPVHHIRATAVGIVGMTLKTAVVGVAAHNGHALEGGRPTGIVEPEGFGAAVAVEAVGGKPHHMVGIAVELRRIAVALVVPREVGLTGAEVAGEDGRMEESFIGICLAEGIADLGRAHGIAVLVEIFHHAVVECHLINRKTATDGDAGGNLETGKQTAAATLRALRRTVGALLDPHLAGQQVGSHKVVDGVLDVVLGVGPCRTTVAVGTSGCDITPVRGIDRCLLRRLSHELCNHE